MGSTEKMDSIVRKRIAKAAHGMVRDYCAETGDTETDIAYAVGLSESYLNGMLNDHSPLRGDIIVKLTRALNNPSVIHEIAALCGGMFISVPAMKMGSQAQVITAAQKAIKEGAEVSRRIFAALDDGVIDEVEAAEIESKVMKHIQANDVLLRCVKMLERKKPAVEIQAVG